MSTPFAGKWSFVRNEHMDPLLEAINAPPETREMVESPRPLEMMRQGDRFTIKTETPKGTMQNTFKLNEPFDQKYGIMAGRQRRAMATAEGEKLIIRGMGEVDPIDKVVETREVHGDEMVVTWNMGDVWGKRFYKRM